VIAQVVVMMDEAVIKGFERGVTNLFSSGDELREFSFDGSFGLLI